MSGGLSHGAEQRGRPSTTAVIASMVAALVVPALVVLIFSLLSSEEPADPGPAPPAGHGAPAGDGGVAAPAGGDTPAVGPSCEAEDGDPIRYIGTAGSDDADGLTPETAWATMQHAVENAPAGATAYLLKGAYRGFAWDTHTDRTGYVTFRPNPGDAVRVEGFYTPNSSTRTDWVAFDCLTFNGTLGAKIRGEHVRFTRLRIPSSGISVEDGSRDVLVEGNDVGRGNPLTPTCIGLWSSYDEPKISDVVIRGNRCEGLKYVGMNLRNFERVLVEDNLVAGITRPDSTHTNAIRTYHGGTGLVVRRNVIRDNVAIGFFIKDGMVRDVEFTNNVIGPMAGAFKGFQVHDVEGIVVANNTVDDASVFCGRAADVTLFNNVFSKIDYCTGAAVEWTCKDYNIFEGLSSGGPDPGPNGRVTDVRYVAAGEGRDWRLRPRSAGVDDGGPACKSTPAPETDADGEARPRGTGYDVGAYEQ